MIPDSSRSNLRVKPVAIKHSRAERTAPLPHRTMLRIAALVACVASASAFAPGAMSARSHRQPLSGFISHPVDAAAPSLCPQMLVTARADAQWAHVCRPMQLKGATSTCKLPVAAARPAVIRATVVVNNVGRCKRHLARCRLPPGSARARHHILGAALVDGLP